MTFNKRIHVLETRRLYLFEIDRSDAEGMFIMNNDSRVMQYTGDKPFSSMQSALDFCDQYNPYVNSNMGRWTMRLKENGDYVGWCGLKKNSISEVDLGFRLAHKYWGVGYAHEAALACMQYGFEHLRLKHLIARTHPKNEKSIRLIQRLNFEFLKEEMSEGEDWRYFQITNPNI